MDLGIEGKKAIVCAASKGLGKACAMSLARNGVDLVINFGEACAFLCAASSGFIVGQNLLLDGGAFNSTMG
jgi:hypothetical protein